ncbi:recombinase family protein [Lelliottia wanjuensis]|uniref:recombinase family protein n=1 Tax=Lelliottia wanjuensis TaxID=3050585 RepID=UPI00254E6BEB|nr:recombinase family protein [Lelliottia sp. V86_10]MDK9585889.1 recombinase family protein [Lelliottia sp. V86_10]
MFQQKPTMQAISYTRFSSEIQKKGISIQRQNGLVQDWLSKNPAFNLVSEYYDEAKSAFKGEHDDEGGQLFKLRRDITSGRYQKGAVLLVEAVDRLSRQGIVKTNQIIYEILEAGVNIVLLSDGDKIYTWEELNTNPLLSMVITMKAEQAREESAKKSKRGLENWKKKRESGKIITRACPAWLTANEDKTAFLPVEPHLTTVKRIFKMRLEGVSLSRIAQALNDDSTPNFKGGLHKWNQTTIQQLVNNPAVYGCKVISRQATDEVKAIAQPQEDYYTFIDKSGERVAAISLADFNTCKKMAGEWAKGRAPSSDNPNLTNIFKSVMVCAHCGATMIMNSVTPSKMGYYVCSMKRQGRCDQAKAIRRDMVDDCIINGLLYNTENLLSGTNIDKEELNQSIAEKEQAIAKRKRLVDMNLSGRIDDAQYDVLYDQLTATIDQLDFQIESQRAVMNQSFKSQTILDLNLSDKADRTKLQVIVKDTIKVIRLNGVTRTCDIEMTSGYILNRFPLSYITDGEKWIEVLHLLGEREYTFTGLETRRPYHQMFKQVTEWQRLELAQLERGLPKDQRTVIQPGALQMPDGVREEEERGDDRLPPDTDWSNG